MHDMMATQTEQGPVVINVEHLNHVYSNGFQALKDINLQIHQGDFVAFIGQNGSGKTTLAKHFVALLRPTSGKVFVGGEDIEEASVVDLAREIGYVFQNADDQIFSSTVADEVAYGPKNLGLKESEIAEAVDQSLSELSILHLKDQHPLALSWGDRQKVAIASVLANGPQILILDEPTTGQDMRGGHEILRTCQRLNEQGKTIIVITHNMELVAEYCKKVFLLYSGEILTEGKVDDVFLEEKALRQSYISPPQITRLASLVSDEIVDFPVNVLTVNQMSRELAKRIKA